MLPPLTIKTVFLSNLQLIHYKRFHKVVGGGRCVEYKRSLEMVFGDNVSYFAVRDMRK